MKWINPLKKKNFFLSKFEVVVEGGGQKSHLNQKCRKFHEMDKSTKKNFFHCLADLDLENFFCQSLRWWWGGGVKNHTWTKNAGNFIKWINPLKNFHCLANLDLEKFLSKFEVVGGGVKNHTWTKNAGNFIKWINPLKNFFTVWPIWT